MTNDEQASEEHIFLDLNLSCLVFGLHHIFVSRDILSLRIFSFSELSHIADLFVNSLKKLIKNVT